MSMLTGADKYKSITKGGIIFESAWWYVIVNVKLSHDGRVLIDCICDNANNIYCIEIKNIDFIATASEAMYAVNFSGCGDEKIRTLHHKRPIPVDVIAEVLSGIHDKRFS